MTKLFTIILMLFLVSCMAQTGNGKAKKTTATSSAITKAGSTNGIVSAIAGKKSIAATFVNDSLSANADSTTPDCTIEVLKGWKCLNTTVTSSEGLTYKIAVKWNRPNMSSAGTVLMAVGGSGRGESRLDAPSKLMMDQLDQLDGIRMIQLEFLDEPTATNTWGGYFQHFGGYTSASAAFVASLELILNRGLIKGTFLNYLGGSNGSTVVAYAMSHHGIDRYFDRMVFQMGPFLPSLRNACDPNSASSFSLNTPDQQKSVANLINYWNFGDVNKNVCSYLSNDRTSILTGGKATFPNTQIHVIIGAKEETDGFGKWILASNLEWFNGIQAKSKSRIIRPEMAHNNSYEDMRRYLKLAPHEVAVEEPVVANCNDTKGTFPNGGQTIEWLCKSCNQTTPPAGDQAHGPWNYQGNGCYHRVLNVVNHCSSGQFCASGKITLWNCHCGTMDAAWVSQGQGCYHRATTTNCQ